jgi:hypothetical protein
MKCRQILASLLRLPHFEIERPIALPPKLSLQRDGGDKLNILHVLAAILPGGPSRPEVMRQLVNAYIDREREVVCPEQARLAVSEGYSCPAQVVGRGYLVNLAFRSGCRTKI